MKRFSNVVFMVAMLFVAVNVQAADFDWSSDYRVIDNTTVYYHAGQGSGIGSVGIFIGTLGEVKQSGRKILGIGGFNFNADAEGRLIFGVVPVTAFDDMLQMGIAVNPAEFRVDDLDSYMFSLGVSISEIIDKFQGE